MYFAVIGFVAVLLLGEFISLWKETPWGIVVAVLVGGIGTIVAILCARPDTDRIVKSDKSGSGPARLRTNPQFDSGDRAPEEQNQVAKKANDGNVDVGLIINEPWISKILAGESSWEMRSTRTSKRESIALIRKGSGLVVGVATIVDCLGPLSDVDLVQNSNKHCFPVERIGKRRFAWVMSNVLPLDKPVPYRHRAGAVRFVHLDPDVTASVSSSVSGGVAQT